jgi:3-hydroxy-9,10-secoandrosta-1,3,5(10)-triene-9,17-dione monooxygenase
MTSTAVVTSLDDARRVAERLAATVSERRMVGEELRRMPDDTIDDFVDSGLLRMNQAARWGGLELGSRAVVDLVSAVAEGDGASGWVFGLLASHFWLGSVFDLQAQYDMWDDDPDALMSSSFAAEASDVAASDGGYRVSGRWPFSSGSDHCSWAMVGIMVPPKGGEGPPTPRWCLLPRTDYAVEDTWSTCALRGTGSNTVVIDDAFVPEYRTVDPVDVMEGRAPGSSANLSPIFRLSFSSALSGYLGSTAIGIAKRAARDFAGYSSKKVSKFTGLPELSDSMIIHVGTVAAHAEAAHGLMMYRAGLLDALIDEGVGPTLEQRLATNRDVTTAVRMCVDAVELAMRFSGGSGLFDKHTIQQAWRDVHGVAAHMGYNTDTVYGNWGRQVLDLPLPPGFS